MSGLPNQEETEPPPGGPVPVEPLHYVMPERAGRPGMVTTIGVISIVVASLSGFYGLVSGLQTVSYYFMAIASSQAAAARATVVQTRTAGGVATSVTWPGSPAAGPASAPVGSFAMGAAERDAAVAMLSRRAPMTPARQRQLAAILASPGADIRPDTVREAGTMPPPISGDPAPHYFVTDTGRLEVFNDRAVFFPASNAPAIRTSAPPGGPAPETAEASTQIAGGTGPIMPSTTAAAIGALSPAESAAVVAQAQAASGGALNPAQVTALQTLLSTAGQQLVLPGGSQGSVVAAVVQPSGVVVIQFADGGSATLGPQGNVLGTTAAPVMPTFNFSPAALATSLACTVASLALAVFLLVSGIVTLRQSPRGRRLHLVYATLKIPLEIVGAVAGVVVGRELMSGMANVPGGGASSAMMVYALITSVVPALLGIAYPVGLLVALNQRSMREYYGAATPPAA